MSSQEDITVESKKSVYTIIAGEKEWKMSGSQIRLDLSCGSQINSPDDIILTSKHK